ncbi:MAG: phenylacetate--CoA ligase family protein [Pirellula sp.]
MRERCAKAGVNLEGETSENSFALLRELEPIAKRDISTRFPGGVVTQDRGDGRSYRRTSGTTGERLTVLSNFRRRDIGRSTSLYVFDVATGRSLGLSFVDIPPNACNTVCGLEGPPITSWTQLLLKGLKEGSFFKSSFRSDVHGLFQRRLIYYQQILPPIDARSKDGLIAQVQTSLDSLAAIKPQVLRAFPQYLLWMSEINSKGNRRLPSLGYAMPYGGLAASSLLARVRSGLGVETRNVYGTSELGPIAVACDHQMAMHVLEQVFEIEVMRDGRVVADGEVGEIVATDLANTAMPLIRYKVGDVGRIVPGKCSCGRTTRRIEILGRIQETIRFEDRWITAAQIADTAYSDPSVSNFRLDEISSMHFELQLVPSLLGGQPDVASIKDRFASLFREPIKVSHRIVPYLAPESNGKFLVCRLRSNNSVTVATR